MQSKAEFDATIRVLKALRKRVGATIVMTWDDTMQRVYPSLHRGGYVRTIDKGRGGPFKWDEIELTEFGRTYLDSIEAAQRKGR